MATQPLPTELSMAERIPLELWERIAYYTNARVDAFLGPPADIPSLSLVSRSLNHAIRFDNNPSLYTWLFCFKFDYHAPLRRLGKDCLTVWSIAQEFKKRITALKRPTVNRMLENDGKNERQLIEWARLYGYLKRETCTRYETDAKLAHELVSGHRRNISSTLVMVDDVLPRFEILWSAVFCTASLLQASVIPVFMDPNRIFTSLYPLMQLPSAWFSTSPTPVAHVNHYSKDFDLATPLLSLASLLVWTTRLETTRESVMFDRSAVSSLPLDRETAVASMAQGPTQMDVLKFHELQIHAPTHCPLTLCTSLPEQILAPEDERPLSSSGSRCYDSDWFRSVACSNPFSPATSNHSVYTPGALVGLWGGFFVQTSLDVHLALVDDPNLTPSESTMLYRHPLYFTLQEHHCLHPSLAIAPGNDCLGGEDYLNAWLPQGLKIKQCENEIEVYDPKAQRSVCYQTFFPEGSVETNEQKEDQRLKSTPRYATSSYFEDKLNDILVTGKTSDEDGEAWGHYIIVGRVRLWDGLVALLRTPRDPTRSELGRWLFRGYIHNRNLVGHWRETSTPPQLVGYQGGFVARNYL
ncbi:hypothetical protein BT96DRAFT_992174 [Gymnopus androsaceus JB14]|uniref:F-box domain-containing protein n=1 Tax=Gymnopus androsaceus JB14 TaxID=1447944 RepID=A0A6A4HXH2_9AGAR|nr:hypothetical protein BT96DRAFT_992174 [Gymnopus androsaceus JB14]